MREQELQVWVHSLAVTGYLTVSVHLFTRAREREVMLEQKEKEDSQQQQQSLKK